MHKLTTDQLIKLFQEIAHGGDKHKLWLLAALVDWNRGLPVTKENEGG